MPDTHGLNLTDEESICTECGKRINDKETKWNKDAEPFCPDCFAEVTK